jgi:hypothetical protein
MGAVRVPLVRGAPDRGAADGVEAVDRRLLRVVVPVLLAGGDHDPRRPDRLIELLGAGAVGAVVGRQEDIDAVPSRRLQFVGDPVGDARLDVAVEEKPLAVQLEQGSDRDVASLLLGLSELAFRWIQDRPLAPPQSNLSERPT